MDISIALCLQVSVTLAVGVSCRVMCNEHADMI